MPEEFINWKLGQRLFWHPVAWDEETVTYFADLGESGGIPDSPIPMNLVGAAVLELIRGY